MNIQKRNCEHCREEFSTSYRPQRFCSHKCHDASRRLYEGDNAARKRAAYVANIEESRKKSRLSRNRYRREHPEKIVADHRKQTERRAQRNGNLYMSRAERWIQAVKCQVERIVIRELRRKPTQEQWIERLKAELPHLYGPALKSTLVFRARYHLDPEFRRKQITRTATRASDPYAAYDDGTITNALFCSLFSVRECLYCGTAMRSEDKTLDHIVPRLLGGWHSAKNVIVCCYSCNSKKRAKPPQAWLTKIDPSRVQRVIRAWRKVMGCGLDQAWLFNQSQCNIPCKSLSLLS